MKTSPKFAKATVAPSKARRSAAETKPRQTARLFTNGASQAVRLPKEFRMEGKEVRIWKEGNRVVLEPVDEGWDALFEALEEFPKDFMIERNQPPVQVRDWDQGSVIAEPAPAPYRAKRKRS